MGGAPLSSCSTFSSRVSLPTICRACESASAATATPVNARPHARQVAEKYFKRVSGIDKEPRTHTPRGARGELQARQSRTILFLFQVAEFSNACIAPVCAANWPCERTQKSVSETAADDCAPFEASTLLSMLNLVEAHGLLMRVCPLEPPSCWYRYLGTNPRVQGSEILGFRRRITKLSRCI